MDYQVCGVWSYFLFCTSITCIPRNVSLTDIYMIGLFPLSGAWDGGLAMRPAALMAVDDINRRNDILPGYRLHLECHDTECNAGLGVKTLADMVCEQPTKIMIIGGACSPVSQAVAQVAHRWNLVQISYVSSSPALSWKHVYPNFFRIVTSETVFNEAWMEIFKHFNWRRVATMHQSFQLFSTITEDLVSRMKKANFQIAAQVIFSDDPETAVRRLKETDARIIMGAFYKDKARKVFCAAHNLGFYGSQVWLLTGSLAYDDTWWKQYDPKINCTPAELEKIVQNSLCVHNIYFNPNGTEGGLTGMSAQRFREIFSERTRNMTQPVSGADRAPAGYDTVWAAAIALNKTMNNLTESGNRKTLASFTYSDKELANLLKTKLEEVRFISASGHIAFDENGDGNRLVGIQMIKGSGLIPVGVYDRTSSNRKRLHIDDIWKGNTPKDSIETKRVDTPLLFHNYIIMSSLSSLGIILAIIFLTFNIVKRNFKIIRLSSPNINNIILVGCILSYLSVYVEDVSNTKDSIFCKVKVFLLILAFSLAFGALFAKTWRVHAVFTASIQMKKRSIQDHSLCLMIFVLVCLNSLILCVWFLVDPLTIVTEDVPETKDRDSDIIVQYVHSYCSSKYQSYFLVAIMIIQGIFLLLGVFLAWETRKVKFSILNESRYIGMCIYNVVALGVVGVLVSYSLRSNTSLVYVIISCITILCTTVTQCLLFVPKVVAYRKVIQGKLNDTSIPKLRDHSCIAFAGMTATATQTDPTDSQGNIELTK